MPAIEWISVEGFKSIRSVDRLLLTDVNVIIGSNGSGKSNFIGVFSFLNAIREGRLQEYVARAGGANSLLFLGSKTTDSIYIRLSFNDDVNGYEIRLSPGSGDSLIPISEKVFYWDKRYTSPYDRNIPISGLEAGISTKLPDAISEYVQSHLDRWRLYHFHDTSSNSPMKATNDIDDNRYLRYDGSNLAAFLHMLQQRHPDSYRIILGTIRRVAPFFQDFVLEPSALNPNRIRLEWKHTGSDAYFNASMLSDGSVRFIALATLLLQPAELRPSIILIDEPELGLHPYALTMLASMVKQASAQTQIILSTQSALLLDHFNPGQVLVADKVDNGTGFNRLSEDSLGDWLEDYSLGQLWEKAEFGGRPNGANSTSDAR